MPRLTGTIVVAGGAPAEGAYVQIQNLAGDFQGEVRTDAAGRFVLHPIRGRWRLVCWLPGDGRAEQEVVLGTEDLDVEVALPELPNLPAQPSPSRTTGPESSPFLNPRRQQAGR
jgi:hypothetical protein